MGVKVSPPNSDAVVVIAEELVERYKQQGWTVAGKPAAEVADTEPKKPGRPAKSDK